jgi:multiple sugar transport system permease protein
VLSAAMAAFVFAKIPFRASAKLFGVYLATMMIPGAVTMVPNYIVLRYLGLLDSYIGLILPSLAKAFNVFLMRQAILTVNDAYLESAMLDGASLYRGFFRIVLPMVTPTLATMTLLTFMEAWNNYLWPLIVLSSTEKQTLQVVLGNMNSMYKNNEHVLMAGAVLTILPILAVYLLSQRHVDQGIAIGGLK